MRLGTLARKISVTPTKLTTFLESHEIDLSSGTNTKLDEAQIELVLEHYNASLEAEPSTEEQQVTTDPSDAPSEKVVEEEELPDQVEEDSTLVNDEIAEPETSETIVEESDAQTEETVSNLVSDSFAEMALPHELEDLDPENTVSETEPVEITAKKEEEKEETKPKAPLDIDPDIESSVERAAYDDSIEVIKPPKVQLQGLTVKGKIDLPEPKQITEEEPQKEEKPYNPDEIITTTGPKRDRKRKPKNYKGKKYDKGYNPVEAARKKKEWEEKKRKEREEKRKKNAKAQHYKKTVVSSTQVSSAVKKKPKKATAKKKLRQDEPKGNMLQRFWRWMNT